MLHTVVSHHALVERGKDKTVKNIKSLKRSIGTVIANVPANCILRSHISRIHARKLPLECPALTSRTVDSANAANKNANALADLVTLFLA